MRSLPSPAGEAFLHPTKNRPAAFCCRAVGLLLLLDRIDDAIQVMLVLADDLDGVAVIQAHHAQNALGIGDAALHVMHADIVIALGGSRHDSLDLSKIGNLDLFHHNK